MNGIPRNTDEFEMWAVDKLGSVVTALTDLHGKLDVLASKVENYQKNAKDLEEKIEKQERWSRIQHIVNGAVIPINITVHAVLKKLGINI